MAPTKQRISPELLQKIKEAVSIVDVVGEHVVLRKSGSNFTGLCPFHSERSPSFSVSANKQLYHCYGCKRGGDVVTFLEELHGISFIEAVEELSDRASVALPKGWEGGDKDDPAETAKRRAARDKLQTAYKLNRFVAAFYHHSLGRSAAVGAYLTRRGVGADQVRSFYVGSAPPAWEALAQHLASKKAPLPLASELGLIRSSTKATQGGVGYFDLFRNRVMFPIVDLRGKVVGFGGRTTPEEAGAPAEAAGGEKSPKYLNSPESFLFHKSKVAFGLFQAQKHIRETRELILVEGYFDVIAMHAAGFENVVATCGTSLTPDHLNLFRRFADRIIVLFDGDKAGVSATERAMEVGLEHGLVLHGAAMPPGLDPDELVLNSGREKMQAILAAARPLLDERIDETIRSASEGAEARTQAIKRIGAWLNRFRDPIGKEVRLQDVRTRLNIPASLLPSTSSGGNGGGQGGGQSPSRGPKMSVGPDQSRHIPGGSVSTPSKTPPPPRIPPWNGAEKLLVRALVRGGESVRPFEEMSARLPSGLDIGELFDHPAAREWVRRRLRELGGISGFRLAGTSQPGAGAQTTYDDQELDPQVRSIVTEEAQAHDVPINDPDLRTLLEKRIAKVWARFSQQIKVAIADAEAKQDAGLEKKLKQEYLDVQRKMKEFISFYDEA